MRYHGVSKVERLLNEAPKPVNTCSCRTLHDPVRTRAGEAAVRSFLDEEPPAIHPTFSGQLAQTAPSLRLDEARGCGVMSGGGSLTIQSMLALHRGEHDERGAVKLFRAAVAEGV